MPVTSIEVEHVSKLFHKRYQRTLKQTMVAKLTGARSRTPSGRSTT